MTGKLNLIFERQIWHYLFLPGLLFASKAALVVALFNHLYIWVHYYTLEKPDIKRIYR